MRIEMCRLKRTKGPVVQSTRKNLFIISCFIYLWIFFSGWNSDAAVLRRIIGWKRDRKTDSNKLLRGWQIKKEAEKKDVIVFLVSLCHSLRHIDKSLSLFLCHVSRQFLLRRRRAAQSRKCQTMNKAPSVIPFLINNDERWSFQKISAFTFIEYSARRPLHYSLVWFERKPSSQIIIIMEMLTVEQFTRGRQSTDGSTSASICAQMYVILCLFSTGVFRSLCARVLRADRDMTFISSILWNCHKRMEICTYRLLNREDKALTVCFFLLSSTTVMEKSICENNKENE